jgi:PPP family 3-phenylpropionic acid transporter
MQLSFWCSIASFSAFTVAYFDANGHSASDIGIMLAIYTLGSFAGSFVFGQMCDRLRTHKKVFIGSSIAAFVVSLLVYYSVHTPYVVFLYALLGFILIPIISNMDTWILKSFPEAPQEYGPIRAWGSLGFAGFAVFYGGLITRFGFGIMLPFNAFFTVINIVFAIMIPDARAAEHTQAATSQKDSLKGLLRNARFLLLLVALFLLGIVVSPINQYIAMIFNSVGGNVTYQSWAMSISAFIEIPMMMLSGKLVRFSPYHLLLGAAGLYLAGNATVALSHSPIPVLGAYLLAGLGYGILLPTLRQAVFDSSPAELHTTAQGLSDSFFSSLAGMLSSLAGGFILDATSVSALMWICCSITIPIVPLFLMLAKMAKRPERTK